MVVLVIATAFVFLALSIFLLKENLEFFQVLAIGMDQGDQEVPWATTDRWDLVAL